MQKKQYKMIFNLMLVFVILQPFLDILSNLYIEGILNIGISTYLKPIFIFIITLYLFIKYSKNKKWWFLYGCLFLLFLVGHYFILKSLYIDNSIINHEFRFIINIIYMIMLFFDFNMLYKLYPNKKDYLFKVKRTVALTFILYCILLILAVITNTSGLTYEYADSAKKGFKGWFDSGQILGHSISIMFPTLLYTLLKPRYKWIYRILFITPIIIVVSLLGTKVPYFIVVIVLAIYLIISIYNKIFNKHYKLNVFNLCFVFICLISMIFTYKYTPVYSNVKINAVSSSASVSSYGKETITASETLKYYNNLIEKNSNNDIKELKKYKSWITKSSNYLMDVYEKDIIHPSNTRAKQVFYSAKMFNLSTAKYKIFGIGYLNHFDLLSPESDFFMALLSFGILGFLLFLFVPLKEFIRATIYMIKNIKTNDLETYLLYASFGIFFCISIYAGYTYIYTNFSIFLVLLVMMLKCKIDINEDYKREETDVKNITFLMLHLGYGGIETSTINTANALSKKYNVELISFYKLDDDQSFKLNKKIKVKYLYNGGPNKKELINSIKNKNIFKIILEGFKSLDILLKKKLLIIKEIRKSKSDALISTRVEFSTLLSKYGKIKQIKIAQEHHHHNNNKKYINKLKYKYDNINYLFALTETLEEDYKKFLKYNNTTEIVLMPNMIKSKFKEFTDLKNNNIIFVGRLHDCKRVDDLVRIFSKLQNNNHKLYIIGDGDEYKNIRNLINELNLEDKIEMLGYLDQKEIAKYLVKSKVFCMTSLTEGLPMVLLEAMSYGVPCIAYNTESGVKDIIDNNENGFVIYDRNEKEYIEKLDSMMSNNKLLSKLSKNAIKKAKSFSEKEIIKRWDNILKGDI